MWIVLSSDFHLRSPIRISTYSKRSLCAQKSKLGVPKWRRVSENLLEGQSVTIGAYNRIYAIYCDVSGNGDGVIVCGEKKGDLGFINISNVNGQLVITTKTSLSGSWFVKDITNR